MPDHAKPKGQLPKRPPDEPQHISEGEADPLDDALEDSFPASDPPAATSITSTEGTDPPPARPDPGRPRKP